MNKILLASILFLIPLNAWANPIVEVATKEDIYRLEVEVNALQHELNCTLDVLKAYLKWKDNIDMDAKPIVIPLKQPTESLIYIYPIESK